MGWVCLQQIKPNNRLDNINNRNHFKKHTIDTMLKDQSRHFKEYETSRRWIALDNKETQNKTTVAFDTFDKQI